MAKIYRSVYGTRYNASEPLYLTTQEGVLVFDRVKNRYLDWDELNAKATDENHTWQPREVGIPSIMWQLANWNGQNYAPGLDDTEALASEIVVNGEVWTGATGTTPPTSWTSSGGDETFTYVNLILDIDSAVTGGSLSQTLTGTPGVYYVLEFAMANRSTDGGALTLGGVTLPLPPGDPYGIPTQSRTIAVSFVMPAAGTIDLMFTIRGGGKLGIKHCRAYLESELTGNPGGAGGGGGPVDPPLPETEVNGPYMAGSTTYFIQSFPATGAECLVWLDVDSDPDPDLKLSLQQVCESEIEDMVKMEIDANLRMNMYCDGLPCMTQAGKVQKAYSWTAPAEPTVEKGDE